MPKTSGVWRGESNLQRPKQSTVKYCLEAQEMAATASDVWLAECRWFGADLCKELSKLDLRRLRLCIRSMGDQRCMKEEIFFNIHRSRNPR